jgi:3-ketosteroid 9alpha-monooxygenase subunit B
VQVREPRKPPQEFEVSVRKVTSESPDTVTLQLEPTSDAKVPPMRAGQFLTIDARQFRQLNALQAYLEGQKGHRETPRAYSLTSAPHEPLAITVKDEPFVEGQHRYPPLLAPLLVHGLRAGDRVRVKGFNGPYVLPDEPEAEVDTLLHVVAGSGAVPNYAILKDALHRGIALKQIYLASNKTAADILFRSELARLAAAYPDRLRVVHTLTRDSEENAQRVGARQGRITKELIEELVPDLQRCRVYICGPAITAWDRRKALETKTTAEPRFLESVLAQLHALKISDRRIKREAYG